MKLKDSIRYIKGVGPAKEEVFNKVGIATVEDLIYYFPRDYEDRTQTKKIMEMCDGEKISFEGEISGNVIQVPTRKMSILKATAFDETGRINLTWFNAIYVKAMLKPNTKYIFYGTVERNINGISMVNPIFEEKNSFKKTGKILLHLWEL